MHGLRICLNKLPDLAVKVLRCDY